MKMLCSSVIKFWPFVYWFWHTRGTIMSDDPEVKPNFEAKVNDVIRQVQYFMKRYKVIFTLMCIPSLRRWEKFWSLDMVINWNAYRFSIGDIMKRWDP